MNVAIQSFFAKLCPPLYWVWMATLTPQILLVGGGRVGIAYLDSVERLELGASTWVVLNHLPRKMSEAAAVVYRNQVTVLGGYDGREDMDEVRHSRVCLTNFLLWEGSQN